MALESVEQWCDNFQKKTIDNYIANYLLEDDIFNYKESAIVIALLFIMTITFFGGAWACGKWLPLWSMMIGPCLFMAGLASGFVLSVATFFMVFQKKIRRQLKADLRALKQAEFIARFKVEPQRDPTRFESFDNELHRPEVKELMKTQHCYSIGDPLTLKQCDIEALSLVLTPDEFVSFTEYVRFQGQCKFMQVLGWLEVEQLKQESQSEIANFNKVISTLQPSVKAVNQTSQSVENTTDLTWQINRLADVTLKKEQ